MKRLFVLLPLALLAASLVFAQLPQLFGFFGSVNLSPANPEFTMVDPFSEGLTPANPLKPKRPFWYSVDKEGITIVGLRTEMTGALQVGGTPIQVTENVILNRVLWPDAISVVQPDGEIAIDPSVEADHDKFAWRPVDGWEPVGITASYPTDEALASNSETPSTFVYVVMKHSGLEWASSMTGDPANGVDPNLRDTIRPATSPDTESSLLVQIDVSDPTYPVLFYPTGPPVGGALLGHDAGQPAFDPAIDSVYVGGMPSTSLPTTPDVPVDLTSFVSVVMVAPPEVPVPGETPAPVTVTVLCGPEHPDIPLLVGVPQSWACIGEGGEGPFEWTFTDLPTWLIAHVDPLTGQNDGILYGTPPTAGTWTFDISVLDHASTPPGSGTATVTLITTTDPTTEYEYGELEFELGAPAGVAIEGTLKPGATGDPCALTPTDSPGSMVPYWIDVKQIIGPGRTIDNRSVGGPIEHTMGCVVMGTPPISGERFEFQMPNFQFTWPSQGLPIVFSGQVFGPYNFDPLTPGVGLSGLAWHEIDKIHDPSTEADMLNRELFGVEPNTGQMYRIVPAYAGLESEGTVIPPPSLQGELDEVEPFADLLTPLTTARPDIAQLLVDNPTLRVMFGNVAAEAKYDPNVFVTAYQLSDPTGVNPTVIPIGGLGGSAIENGVVMNVQGVRTDPLEPEAVSVTGVNTINLAGMQVSALALDSDLRPAVRSGPEAEPGQVDNGFLWMTGTNTGNVAVVNTTLGTVDQMLTVADATSLGGAWVNAITRLAYVPAKSLQTVIIFGAGDATPIAPVVTAHPSNQTVTVGQTAIFTAGASGMPIPAVQWQINTGGGWSDITGAVSTQFTTEAATIYMNGYQYRAVFTNSQGSATSNAATLTVAGAQAAPVVTTHPSSQILTAGATATFTAAATGDPTPTVQWELSTNGGSSFSPIGGATDPSYTTGVTTTAMNGYQYRAVFTNSQGTATTNAAMLTVNAPLTPPVISTHPANQAVTVGQTATFTAAADGNPAPTVMWQLSTTGGASWSNIPGGNTPSYQTSSTTLSMSGYQYRAVFTNSQGSVNSNPATLTVNPSSTTLSVTTKLMSAGTVSQTYSYQLQAGGGTSPYTWSVARRNNLPSGLRLSSDGVISGTPRQAGTFAFVVQVTDTGAQTATGTLTITINPRPRRQGLDGGPEVDAKTADVNLESKEVLK